MYVCVCVCVCVCVYTYIYVCIYMYGPVDGAAGMQRENMLVFAGKMCVCA